MGAKPTKFHQLYKKIIRRQKQSRKGPSSTEFDISDDDRVGCSAFNRIMSWILVSFVVF